MKERKKKYGLKKLVEHLSSASVNFVLLELQISNNSARTSQRSNPLGGRNVECSIQSIFALAFAANFPPAAHSSTYVPRTPKNSSAQLTKIFSRKTSTKML